MATAKPYFNKPTAAGKSAPAKVIQITSWSFSRYNDWRTCPLKAKLKHIDKMKEPSSPAMDRGAQIHTLAERYIKGQEAKLAPELELFKEEFKKLRTLYKKKSQPIIVEDQWAFTRDWTETQWNNWADCWVRIKLDCAHYMDDSMEVLCVTDWKTGKPSDYKIDEYMEQLELYALSAMLLMPTLKEVHPRLVFTDTGDVFPKKEEPVVYRREDVASLRKSWDARVTPMMSDKKFVAKPNSSCKFCFFGQAGKAKGGPGLCKY